MINRKLIARLVMTNEFNRIKIDVSNAVFTLNTSIQEKNEAAINYVLSKIDSILLNKYDDQFKKTPLQVAILNKDARLIKRLICLGSDPNVKCFYGKDAIDYAIQVKDPQVTAAVLGEPKWFCVMS